MNKAAPWADGYYKMKGVNNCVFSVEGENVKMLGLSGVIPDDPAMNGTWTYGDYGEAHPTIVKETGKTNYDVEIVLWGGMWNTKGVLSSDNKHIFIIGFSNELDAFEWLSEEELTALKEAGDSADAPSSHYKVQPEYQGKLLWITGPPGAGKSTSGQLLSKTAGYVYYEADAFFSQVNPYIPTDVEEPSLATMKQKSLRDVPQERLDACNTGMKHMMAMFEGKEYDVKPLLESYSALCKNIAAERSRLGGDWVVAQAVTSRCLRDHLRSQLGPELIIVILSMSREQQMTRAKGRHSEHEQFTEFLTKAYDLYEPAGVDEPNTIEIKITHEMTKEDVCKIMLDNVNQIVQK